MSGHGLYEDAVSRIKNAVLQSRYRVASSANTEQLNLYFSIGGYISINTRSGTWGSGAIEAISQQLQAELPGLRGYSPSNMKNMRQFYEEWVEVLVPNSPPPKSIHEDVEIRQLPTGEMEGLICQPITGELENSNSLIELAAQDVAVQQNFEAFLRIGFTHHVEIMAKCKDLNERWYYIKRCASEF